MSITTDLPTTAHTATACPAWCDQEPGRHPERPLADVEVVHEHLPLGTPRFVSVSINAHGSGPRAGEAPTLGVYVPVSHLTVEEGERLVTSLAAAVDKLRQAVAAR